MTAVYLFFAIIVGIYIVEYAKTLMESKKEYSKITLIATKTHENRTLHFTKGKEYTFYKTGDHLMINEDDTSRDRENYVFYKNDLDNHFKPTDLLSKLVLENVRYLRY